MLLFHRKIVCLVKKFNLWLVSDCEIVFNPGFGCDKSKCKQVNNCCEVSRDGGFEGAG